MVSAFTREVDYGGNASIIRFDSADADHVFVPDAQLLFTADFRRCGPDLVLTGPDGRHHIIPGYFTNENRPTLIAPNGASLSFDHVDRHAGSTTPGEQAPARPTIPPDPIGKVKKIDGNVIVIRNGAALSLKVGDAVFKSDIIETGIDGLIVIAFVDGTTFNLYASACMVLDEFIWGAERPSNSALFRVVKGLFAFIAGKMATTGGLIIDTPVGQIRSTAPAAGIGSLALSIFTFGLIQELKAASLDIALLDDGTIDYKDLKHGVFEFVTKEAHPRRIVVSDPGETIVLRPGASGTVSIEQVANSPIVMAQYQSAYQGTHDNFLRGQQDPFIQHYLQEHANAPTNNPVNAANNASTTTAASTGSTGSSTSISDQPGTNATPQLLSTTTIATTVVPTNSSAPTVTTVFTAAPQATQPTPTVIAPPSQPSTTTDTWSSTSAANWNAAPQDWSGAAPPGPQSAAVIGSGQSTVDGPVVVGNLTVDAGTAITVVSNADPTVASSLTVAGTAQVAGTVKVDSTMTDPSVTFTDGLTISPGGEVAAHGSAASVFITGGTGVHNSGTVIADDGGTIIFSDVAVNNAVTNQPTGNIEAGVGGTIVFENSTIANAGANVSASGTGAVVQLSDSIIQSGTLSTGDPASNAGGEFEIVAAPGANFSELDGSSNGPLTLNAFVQVDDGAKLELLGSIDNLGTVVV
jgi:hypothetical protein